MMAVINFLRYSLIQPLRIMFIIGFIIGTLLLVSPEKPKALTSYIYKDV